MIYKNSLQSVMRIARSDPDLQVGGCFGWAASDLIKAIRHGGLEVSGIEGIVLQRSSLSNGSDVGFPARQFVRNTDDAEPSCRAAVLAELKSLLLPYVRPAQFDRILADGLGLVASLAVEDLNELTVLDPASRGSWRYVLGSYAAYRATLSYRLAHAVYRSAERPQGLSSSVELRTLARSLSERAKVTTGVEVHPAARIGRRFVLDHAVGAVIGETSVIGDDCYVLQGVILGASGIAGNPTDKRHPTLGNRVQVGAFARILGPVTVGSGSHISPHALIVSDVPEGSRVRIVNQCQVRSAGARCVILGVIPDGPGKFQIFGSGLDGATVDFIDAQGTSVSYLKVDILSRASRRIDCRFHGRQAPSREMLRITMPDGNHVLLTQMEVTWRHLDSSSMRTDWSPS
ncbi:serine O-acetyltransferase [Streptomyces sp. YGL11-2]|uniref:serine O-acetyltransferase n=1 Tax=Streptomyces sp. YGL11-2 TaxID=3414028 RepID=UPI003CEEFEE1